MTYISVMGFYEPLVYGGDCDCIREVHDDSRWFLYVGLLYDTIIAQR
jgi:hypothetical protein